MVFRIDHFGKRVAQLFVNDHIVYIAAKLVLRNRQLNLGRVVHLLVLNVRRRTSQVNEIRIRLLMSRLSIGIVFLLFVFWIV